LTKAPRETAINYFSGRFGIKMRLEDNDASSGDFSRQDHQASSTQFSCQYSQGFILHLNDTSTLACEQAPNSSVSRSPKFFPSSPGACSQATSALQSAVVVTSIACPVTILLNVLVLIAMRQKQELQRSSNILFCSLAEADLLIWTVSMPLTIVFGICHEFLYIILDICTRLRINLYIFFIPFDCNRLGTIYGSNKID